MRVLVISKHIIIDLPEYTFMLWQNMAEHIMSVMQHFHILRSNNVQISTFNHLTLMQVKKLFGLEDFLSRFTSWSALFTGKQVISLFREDDSEKNQL